MPFSLFDPDKFQRLAEKKFFRLLPITPIFLNIIQFIGPAVLTNEVTEEAKNSRSALIFLQFIASYIALGTLNTGYKDTIADIDNLLAISVVLSHQEESAPHILSQSIFLSERKYDISVRFRDLEHLSKIAVAINGDVYAQRQVVDVNIFPGLHCIALREIKGEVYLIYVDGLHLTEPRRQISLKKFLKSHGRSQDVALPIFPHCWEAFESKKSDSGRSFSILEQIWLVSLNYDLIFGSPREKKVSFLDALSALAYGEEAKYLSALSEIGYQSEQAHNRYLNCVSRSCYYAKWITPFFITLSLIAVMGSLAILYKQVTKLKINAVEGAEEYTCANQTEMMKNISHFCGHVFFQYQFAWKVLADNQNNTVSGYLDDAGYLKIFAGMAILLATFGIAVSVAIACYIKKPFLTFTWPEKYIHQTLYSSGVTSKNGIENTDFYTNIRNVQPVNPLQQKEMEDQPSVIVSGLWRRRYQAPASDTAVITVTAPEPFDFESVVTALSAMT